MDLHKECLVKQIFLWKEKAKVNVHLFVPSGVGKGIYDDRSMYAL